MTAIAETLFLLLKDHLAVNGYDEKAADADPLPRFNRKFVSDIAARIAKLEAVAEAAQLMADTLTNHEYFWESCDGDSCDCIDRNYLRLIAALNS